MTTTYTWNIVAMDSYPEVDGETDVVFTTHWTVSGTDGTYTGSVYGTQSVTVDSSEPFTPYDQITLEQAVTWTQEGMGAEQVASIEANIDTQIENQINPPVVQLPLPWAPTE
jgi:hypothetical protein